MNIEFLFFLINFFKIKFKNLNLFIKILRLELSFEYNKLLKNVYRTYMCYIYINNNNKKGT